MKKFLESRKIQKNLDALLGGLKLALETVQEECNKQDEIIKVQSMEIAEIKQRIAELEEQWYGTQKQAEPKPDIPEYYQLPVTEETLQKIDRDFDMDANSSGSQTTTNERGREGNKIYSPENLKNFLPIISKNGGDLID